MNKKMNDTMEKIVSLCKRRGFIYQGSEIYGGLAGTWDYGPLGVALKSNLEHLWWRRFVGGRDDMFAVNTALLMNAKVWEAAGHVKNFTDFLAECKKCKRRFKRDAIKGLCPECGGKLSQERKFNMMFETRVGAVEGEGSVSYLRPETAQGMFVNFKNIIDSFHPKLPFGIAQIGKAFRNEITPRDFLFRTREFQMMEIEYFVRKEEWEKWFDYWQKEIREWIDEIGISGKHIHEVEMPEEERAHYSAKTIDFEFDFPFGKQELYGLAYRTDFDLKNHMKVSGVDLQYYDEESGERFIPHVIEPTFGMERTILAVLAEAYTEDKLGGEKRVFLKLKPNLAPIKVAVFPLLKNKPDLVKKARDVYEAVKKEIPQIMFDDNGNIGKRYRRQDEIGTPLCITIDFETLEDNTVTVRDRDTGKQERVRAEGLTEYLGGI